MKRSKSNRQGRPEESRRSSVNNAFAAAFQEALMDVKDPTRTSPTPSVRSLHSLSTNSDTQNLRLYIQQHDDAYKQSLEVIEGGSSVQGSSRPPSPTSTNSNKSGPPIVVDLPDTSSHTPSLLKRFVSLPKGFGGSRKNSGGNDRKVNSEARLVVPHNRPIPTRQLSRSDSSSLNIGAGNELAGVKPIARTKTLTRAANPGIGDEKARVLESTKTMNTVSTAALSVMSEITGSSTSQSQPSHITHVNRNTAMPPKRLGKSKSTLCILPVPEMPFETKKAKVFRAILALLFLIISFTFTFTRLGDGQVGRKIASSVWEGLVNTPNNNENIISTKSPTLMADGSSLFRTVQEIEFTHEPNVLGRISEHDPSITIVNSNDSEIEVTVGSNLHDMNDDHYIQYIWLRNVEQNTIVLAKEFHPTNGEHSPPMLTAKVPHGVTLQAYAFCTVHHLWRGDPIRILPPQILL